jgi:hypothetical protein
VSAPLVGRRVTQAQIYDKSYTRGGDYAPYELGGWIIRDPDGRIGWLHPSKHQVIEHQDGTITVSPSILDLPEDMTASEAMGGELGAIVPGDGGGCWHGFLERGVWREA